MLDAQFPTLSPKNNVQWMIWHFAWQLQQISKMVFDDEIVSGHFKVEFYDDWLKESFQIIANTSAMIQLTLSSASIESIFLLQLLTYLLSLMLKMWTKHECWKKLTLEKKPVILWSAHQWFWTTQLLTFMNMILDSEYAASIIAGSCICSERFCFSTQQFRRNEKRI